MSKKVYRVKFVEIYEVEAWSLEEAFDKAERHWPLPAVESYLVEDEGK